MLHRWADEDSLVQDAAYRRNTEVLGIAAWGMLGLNLLHIAVFMFLSFDDPVRSNWAHQVATAHGVMALLMSATGLICRRIQANPASGSRFRLLPELASAVIMGWSIVLTVMDQAVSTSINAYINAAVGISIVFLLRPKSALAILLLGLCALAWALNLTTNDPAHLATTRMNATSATALALLVSILLWRRFVQAELLQRALADTNQKLEQQKSELEALATQDSLTGLFNRREFIRRAEYETVRARRQLSPLSLVTMDLDQFKSINDRFGHSAGDAVLRQVAEIMTHSVRQTDIIARYGGEEFVLLLPDTTKAEALHMSERLRQKLASTPTPSLGISVTASIGVACPPVFSALNLEDLLEHADQAMYKAKRQGGNQVVAADMGTSRSATNEKALSADMEKQ